MNEHQLQAWVIKYLRINGIFCFATPNMGKRSVAAGRYFKAEGLVAGVADLTLLLPDGEAVFVELKVGKNTQTDSQLEFESKVKKLGFTYLLWTTQQDAIDFVKGLKNRD